MDKFIALTASGLAYGAILALVALGFMVLYKATGVVNFAHGDLITLGAYVALWAISDLGLPIVVGYLVALVALSAIGLGLERVAYAPLRKRPPIAAVIATLAAAFVIRGVIAVWQGSSPKSLPSPVGNGVVDIAGAQVSQQRLLIIGIATIVVIALVLVFQRTSFGRSVRALAADAETARLQGVRTRIIAMSSFGLSAFLAALAGILIAPLSAVDLNLGFTLMVAAFAAAVLGGFTSLIGVVVGAIVIGLVQQLVGGYLLPDHTSMLPFLLLFIVIGVRPSGLFAVQGSRV